MSCETYLMLTDSPGSSAQAMLWPLDSWQVYCQKPLGRELNLFEQTLLQLFKVSGRARFNNKQLADYLGLEVDMVNYIVEAQLLANGWLDSKGNVTEQGEKMLEGQGTEQLTTAYVFRCAITGQWLPRMCFDFKTILPVDAVGRPKFRLSRGDDRLLVPFVVHSNNPWCPIPDEQELANILRQHREALSIARDTREGEELVRMPSHLETLKLNPDSMQRLWLMVWGDVDQGFEWALYDPFGISDKAKWMQKLFNQGCEKDSSLAQFALNQLQPDNQQLSYAQVCKQMRQAAELGVFVRYEGADKIEGLTDTLVEFIHELKRMEKSDRSSCPSFGQVLLQAVKVLETAACQILKQYPLRPTIQLPTAQSQQSKLLLRHLIEANHLLTPQMVATACEVRPTLIRNVAEGNHSSAKAQLAAIWIAMTDYPEHPFYFLTQDPWLFEQVYRLINARNDIAHGNVTKVSKATAEKAGKTLGQLLNQLFEGLKSHG